MKIRQKLLIVVLLVTVVPVFLVSFLSFLNTRDLLQELALSSLNVLAEFKEGQIFFYLDTLKTRTVDFASDGFISDSLEKISASGSLDTVDTLNSHLIRNKKILNNNLLNIDVLDLNGNIVGSTSVERIGRENLYKKNYFEGIWDETLVKDIFLGEDGRYHLEISTPIQTRDFPKKTIGILVNHYDALLLDDVLTGKLVLELGATSQLGGLGETGEIYLVNEDKFMISGSLFVEDAIFRQKSDTYPVRKCLEDGEEVSGMWKNYLGVEVLVSSMCIVNGNFKWTLISEQSVAEALSPINRLIDNFLIIGFVGTTLVILLAFFVAKHLSKPIVKLTESINKVSGGNLSVKMEDINRKDEIGELNKAFSKMIDRLQISAKDLEKFKFAIDNTSDFIAITDKDGIVLYSNKAVESLTGYTIKEVKGKKIGSLWGDLMPKEWYKELWDTVLINKKRFSGDLKNKRKDGKEFIAGLSVSPILDNAGEVVFLVGVEKDITEKKRVAKAKTEFVSLASHQLRTPLSAINWYTEMLLGGNLGDLTKKQRSYLKEIYNGSQKMVSLVNSFLNVSRIELGTFMIEPEMASISDLVQKALKEFEPIINEKNIDIKYNCVGKCPLVSVDVNLTNIVLQNLISNAVKYTPKKGKVRIKISQKNKKLFILVSDTGIGIPKFQQEKLFTKLFRADNVIKVNTDGTGLGLYIVKSIVDAVGGKVSFKSVEDKGSTFTVSLPLVWGKRKKGTKRLV